MSNRIDLTGKKFNRLTVIDWDGDKHKWHCKCDCGNEKYCYVESYKLTHNTTKSCGCLDKESRRNRAIERNKNNAKYCDYEIQEDYVIMYTPKGDMFLIDIEDLYKVKNLSCFKEKDGYISCRKDGKRYKLHRFLINAPKEMKVDHINHDTTDNRKENLRLVTDNQNQMNRKAAYNNHSGKAGVTYYEPTNKWRVNIRINGKNKYLGSFDNKEEAIHVRIEAENLYYGEYSYTNSMNIENKENVV